MRKAVKPYSLLLYLIGSLFYMELLLRARTATEGFFSSGLGLSLIFALPVAVLLFIPCTLFHSKANRTLSLVLLSLAAVIFSSQLIYNVIFRTYYSIFSAGMAPQALDYWRETLIIIAKNFHWVLLFSLPVILLGTVGKRHLTFTKVKWQARTVMAGFVIVAQLAGMGIVYWGSREPFSAYDLYYRRNYPVLSVQRLGLLTTMRLDCQRLAMGWTPPLELPPEAEQPVFPPGKSKERNQPTPVDYNILDINFKLLYAQEEDETIADMHRYFASVQPTEKNDYTGIYEGYNLILLTAEAFSSWAVREDLTPTLYKMVHEGYHFTNFYTPIWGVSTSDGEYVACTSLLPKSGVWSFFRSGSNFMPFVMGNQLGRLGYETVAYHNHTYSYYRRHISHPNMGYVYKGIGNGLKMTDMWPRSDLEMMQITLPEYIDKEPFHAYYMTVSGHLLYNFIGHDIARKNRHLVEHLPYSDAVRAYLAANIELDRALEHLLNELKKAGIADRTLIALSSDHYPYGLEDEEIDELAGHFVERNFEMHRNTFILYTPGMEPEVIDKPCSSLDIIPTLSNLLGLEYDSRLLMGRDIFSSSEPLVIFECGSFITDKGRYNAKTDEFFPAADAVFQEEVDEYVERISAEVARRFYYSALILDTDYYSSLFPDGRP